MSEQCINMYFNLANLLSNQLDQVSCTYIVSLSEKYPVHAHTYYCRQELRVLQVLHEHTANSVGVLVLGACMWWAWSRTPDPAPPPAI